MGLLSDIFLSLIDRNIKKTTGKSKEDRIDDAVSEIQRVLKDAEAYAEKQRECEKNDDFADEKCDVEGFRRISVINKKGEVDLTRGKGRGINHNGNRNYTKLNTNNLTVESPLENLDKYEVLRKLGELKDKGVLTEEEFIIEKKKILIK